MKPRIFLVFILILTLLSGCKRLEDNVKEYSKGGRWEILNFKGKAFMLDCDNANIIIRGKKGTKHATIRYIKRIIWNIDDKTASAKAFSKSEIEKTFDDMEIKIESTFDRLYIKARAYSGEAILTNTLSNPKKEFEFEIFLPENSKVFVQNSNGNVSISDIHGGSIYIVNGKGNVTVADAKASIEIKNGEGDIRLDYIDGDFSINNGNGNINLKVENTNNFKVSLTKGDVAAKFEKTSGYRNISYINVGEGNIKFSIGKDVKARIKILSNNDVKSDFKLAKVGDSFYLDLNSGKNIIEIISLKGTIKVEKDY